MHIVTVEEMRELEVQAERQYGLASSILMSSAGKSAAELFEAHVLPEDTLKGLPVLFLLGPGNNGGDGIVMAEHLERAGALISLYRWKERQLTIQGRLVPEAQTATELEACITGARYIIDALLGIGRARPLPADMVALLARVKRERDQREEVRLVAMDLPTGVNADTGEVDDGTIPVDMTITLACPKQGFFFFPAREYMGDLYVGGIGLPPVLEEHLQTEMITGRKVHAVLPARPLNSNKGTFGKVMLLCGSPSYPGSAYLAGSAAGRVGAGLVTLSVTEKMLPVYASSFHEATFVLLPSEEAESHERARVLTEHLDGYRSLLIGPGLGQSANTREVILQILEHLRSLSAKQRPHLIIDADGLNNLSALERWWTLLPEETVITPHPGEMGRLCDGIKVSGGGIERLELARRKAAEWRVHLVLKGACTLVVNPQGQTRINWWGNPALATAGTGDVLAGMIAGFLAQGMKPFDAASSAVYLHTAAADLVTQEFEGGRAGLLASDLLSVLPRTLVNTQHAEF